jgi:hypothetical protein
MATTANVQRRAIAELKLPEYEVPLLISYARSIVQRMTGNARFPAPLPSLATVQAAIEDLDVAQAATLTRAVGTVSVRDRKRQVLVILLQQLKAYVQSVADQDFETAAATIESSGMSVRKNLVLPPRIFDAKPGPTPGSVKLVTPAAARRAGYEWAHSIDGGKTWNGNTFTLQAKHIVTGLERGSLVMFRYRPITKRGPGNWSDPITFRIP